MEGSQCWEMTQKMVTRDSWLIGRSGRDALMMVQTVQFQMAVQILWAGVFSVSEGGGASAPISRRSTCKLVNLIN